jgi:hypothetical protein
MNAYDDSLDAGRHYGYAGCESEVGPSSWLTDQMVAVSRAVNARRRRA